jgi:hypothetical protein
MKRWEKFEIECCDYLNKKNTCQTVYFQNQGGSNAWVSDIDIRRKETDSLVGKVEIKLCPAQSGQFSLTHDYRFSEKNACPMNEHTQNIIGFIKEHPDLYRHVNKRGIPILCNEAWLYDWVKTHYRQKATAFIMTSTRLHGCKRIVPIDQIEEYFHVRAVVRRKRSGSRHVPIKERSIVCDQLLRHSEKVGFTFTLGREKRKTFAYIDQPMALRDLSFGDGYYLSETRSNRYYIRKKSNTNNINVVFSLRYKGERKEEGWQYIRNFIERKA